MQYTPGVAAVATATPPRPVATASCPTTRPAGPAATAPALPLTVATASLAAAFAAVPDPRRAQGTRFPLTAILTMAVAAILCNHLSVLAIAEWGAAQSAAVLRALGFPTGCAPHQSTLHRLFRKLDPHALSRTLTHYFDPPPAQARPRGSQGVAIDGKAQRGRLPFEEHAGAPVHALSAFCHELGIVLAQVAISSSADKAEAELSVVPALISQVPWQGRVLTGDALFCQHQLCRQVVQAGGDYLVIVKGNQPTLHADLALLFDPPADAPPPLSLLDRRVTRTVEQGHDRLDIRHLTASTDLNAYAGWPALAQAFQLTRTWQEAGRTKQTVHYGITSLPPDIAPPERVLALRQGHWSIENRLHYVKDVTLGEDRSLVHTDAGPTIMAMLRDTTVSLLRRAGYDAIAARLRYHSRRPAAALALLGVPIG